jgi:hypothetical protein
MKQMLLLLLAVYSLIINQSNKSINHKKIPASKVESGNKHNPTAHLPAYTFITPSFPLEMIMYTGGGNYNPRNVKMREK